MTQRRRILEDRRLHVLSRNRSPAPDPDTQYLIDKGSPLVLVTAPSRHVFDDITIVGTASPVIWCRETARVSLRIFQHSRPRVHIAGSALVSATIDSCSPARFYVRQRGRLSVHASAWSDVTIELDGRGEVAVSPAADGSLRVRGLRRSLGVVAISGDPRGGASTVHLSGRLRVYLAPETTVVLGDAEPLVLGGRQLRKG